MNQRLKKILSYIGVGLLGAVVGVCSLIAVSSCSAKNNDLTKASAETIDSEDVYDFMWTTKTDTSIYYEEISFDSVDSLFYRNSYFNSISEGWHNNALFFIQDDMLFYDSDIPSVYNTIRFQLDIYKGATSDLDKYYLRSIRLQANVGRASYYDSVLYPNIVVYDNDEIIKPINFRISNTFDDLWFGKGNLPHVVIAFNDGLYKGFFEFLNYYFDPIFDFTNSYYFEFNTQLNYNGSYLESLDNTFVQDATFTTSNPSATVVKTYDVGYFLSGGDLFNQIKIYYANGYASRYMKMASGGYSASNFNVLSSAGFGYYTAMIYYNTVSEKSVVVNSRNYGQFTDSDGNLQVYIANSSTWLSSTYRTIRLASESEETLKLSVFNENSYNTINFSGSDVGLGNVFTLITQAFSSFIPILSINVIPGITIGLLLFLPLITGIIIFIVWLVKR